MNLWTVIFALYFGSIQICFSENILKCINNCICLNEKNQTVSISCHNSNKDINKDIFNYISNGSMKHFSKTLKLDGFDLESIDYQNLATNLESLRVLFIHKSHGLTLSELSHLNNLQLLNVSESIFNTFNISQSSFFKLKTLDLSNNKITSIYIEAPNNRFPKLKSLYLQNNLIKTYLINHDIKIKTLDLSSNPLNFLFESSKCYFNNYLENLSLKNVSAIKIINNHEIKYQIFPPSLKVLNLQLNDLKQIPSCFYLFNQLKLKVLDLSYNKINIISENQLSHECFHIMESINLSHNNIIQISPKSFSYQILLKSLFLHNNYLQFVPLELVQYFIQDTTNSKFNNKTLTLKNNPIVCDCQMLKVYFYLKNLSSPSQFMKCFINEHLIEITKVNIGKFTCKSPELLFVNHTKVGPGNDCKAICTFTGIPKPIIKWITPDDKIISVDSSFHGSFDEKDYRLSAYGNELVIKNIDVEKTGQYKCVAENIAGVSNQTVNIGIIPNSTSTIVLICVACFCFIAAIILNFTNLLLYLCKKHHENTIPVSSEENSLHSESRKKSVVSLNESCYHENFDSTCQQMILDTVVKGAHSVKKTIHDAKNSEFSNNFIERASNLRDRLHIEMPSTSFQLPNISMQNINNNIEKISSSVMTTSHNIASSVGSVLTLKRWTHPQTSASETDESETNSKQSESSEDIKIEQKEVEIIHHHSSFLQEEDITPVKRSSSEPFICKEEEPVKRVII